MSANNSYQSIAEDVEISSAKSTDNGDVIHNNKSGHSAWRRMAAVAVLLVLGVLGYSASSAYSESAEQLYTESSPMDLPVYKGVTYAVLTDRPCRTYLTSSPLAYVFADSAGKAYTAATPGQCAEFAKKGGYDYFGISEGGKCHGGDNISASSKSSCNFQCRGNALAGEKCGGQDGTTKTVTVYRVM